MNKFKITLLAAATSALAVYWANRSEPNQFFMGEFGGVFPATPADYENTGFLYLLDSLGNRIDSVNVTLSDEVCKQFRLKMTEDSVYKAPNRFTVVEAEMKDNKITSIIKARAINPEALGYWQNRVLEANEKEDGQILFKK